MQSCDHVDRVRKLTSYNQVWSLLLFFFLFLRMFALVLCTIIICIFRNLPMCSKEIYIYIYIICVSCVRVWKGIVIGFNSYSEEILLPCFVSLASSAKPAVYEKKKKKKDVFGCYILNVLSVSEHRCCQLVVHGSSGRCWLSCKLLFVCHKTRWCGLYMSGISEWWFCTVLR